MKVNLVRCIQKERKRENNSKWSATISTLERCSACDVVKGAPGPRLGAGLVKNELDAFLLYIIENMTTKIVEEQMTRSEKKKKR